MKYFDRYKMEFYPLSSRKSKVDIEETSIAPNSMAVPLPEPVNSRMETIADEIIRAKNKGRSVILTFGAHTIKNGLGEVLAALAEEEWVTHLATNGAGVIHDWEFAFQGLSSEDVRENVNKGRFGTWEETGFYINLALMNGAYRGFGYGEAIGSMITANGLEIPTESELMTTDIPLWKRAAASDYLELIQAEKLKPGWMEIKHPFADFSIQARAYKKGTPFTSHPMFGHDIIYTHRANRGAAVGRCAERDFLAFADSISNLEDGVYLSIGSAVMSPMIFEKTLSMARNTALRKNKDIRNCSIHVVDLQEETWDWSRGEPPIDNPAYYLRFMKTFNRMGCRIDYTSIDNRDFLLHLYRKLKNKRTESE
ncbi:MAG: hypothetical protein PQJ61_16780 [Spirochaetales bacterium]|uniref:Deoxyhypusine synthase n=1 Tax=Candidatus Thalassospirochaeta sargassi TaxID=3119039 RepID=A0AAJ1IFM0_9SPIO|nr:hypothetical protein [Spirochaetales bacterium]